MLYLRDVSAYLFDVLSLVSLFFWNNFKQISDFLVYFFDCDYKSSYYYYVFGIKFSLLIAAFESKFYNITCK